MLNLKNLAKSFGGRQVLHNVSLSCGRKGIIAIMGSSGIGKTTLIKTLLGKLQNTSGELTKHRELKIGYIQQNDYDLTPYETCFDYLKSMYPNKLDTEIRTALGSFLFKKDKFLNDCFDSILKHPLTHPPFPSSDASI